MAGRLVTLGGIALAAVVTAGTWLYVAGIAPPYPWNLRAFQLLLLVCLGYALLLGRTRE